jgi:hypothetical protein
MRCVDLIIFSLFLREEFYGKRVLVLESCLALLNPNSAVGYEVMSEEQTFRSEDNAFCL